MRVWEEQSILFTILVFNATMSSSLSRIRHIMDFLSISAHRRQLGFETPLRLSYFTMNPKLMHSTGKAFTYRYMIHPGVCLNGKTVSLSTYLAIIDSLTTFALVGAHESAKSSRPGVSVQLQAELNHNASSPAEEVDIISTVTKLGGKLAFIRAEVRTVDTGDLVCFASHIKYLPTGSWMMDFLFSSWGWHLMKIYLQRLPAAPAPEESSILEAIKPYLEPRGLGLASFTVKKEHNNGFETLHGGCQSILMEIVSQPMAKEELKSDQIKLESIQVAFAASGRGTVDIVTKVLSKGDKSMTVRVSLLRSDGKVISEGTLRWSIASAQGQSKL